MTERVSVWWSASKKGWKALREMHDRELLNSFRKLQRGEYLPPEGPLTYEQKMTLELAFHAEFSRRDMDPAHPTGRVEPPPAEE